MHHGSTDAPLADIHHATVNIHHATVNIHHATVNTHRDGEPLGALVFARARTVIESATEALLACTP